MLAAIVWDVSPKIFESLSIRWYGLLFACAFFVGYELLKRMFKHEGHPEEWTDKALLYTMAGTILGARLGHVFFYDWSYYKDHLIEIPKIWEGGLASHGAAIGIIIALILLSKKVTKKSPLFLLDRVVITVVAGAVLIRLGNLMNSEIIGKPTGTDWGFIFTAVDDKVRYPTQLIESGAYFLIFLFLYYLFYKTDAPKRNGRLFGFFMILLFTARFFIEFLKENQSAFENDLAFNMGQLLSIPLVLAGAFFAIRSYRLPTN